MSIYYNFKEKMICLLKEIEGKNELLTIFFFCFLVGLNPDIDDEYESMKQTPVVGQSTENTQLSQKTLPKFNKISFEDYHFTWSDIATCKAKGNFENSCKF